MITVIAPHGRPQFSENLLANFRRQFDCEARLLVVENSAAVGRQWPSDVIVCSSEPHQASAMNAGLAWLTRNGGGPWARFDDDDYYSGSYLSEVLSDLEQHEVVGKTWGFIMFDDGLYRFPGAQLATAECLTGGSLAGRSPAVAEFQHRDDDDVQWCRDMRERGANLWAGPHRGYCYDRQADRRGAERVIATKPMALRWGFGAGEYYGVQQLAYVDSPGAPLRQAPPPTDEDLMAEFCSA